jgi:DNA-directed RNA polymerase specialized sigma24 family protein
MSMRAVMDLEKKRILDVDFHRVQTTTRGRAEVNMPKAKQMARSTQYATCADFQRIFDEDMNSFYALSLLLTADREKAEQCFVSGLDGAVDGNPVFKEWARSWARRAIIQNAVRMIQPRPTEDSRSRSNPIDGSDKTLQDEQQVEMAAVLELEPFERFVYVMTILEHYSDYECSLLLNCARRDVLAARTRAFQQLGSALEKHSKQLPTAQHSTLHERLTSVPDLMVARA